MRRSCGLPVRHTTVHFTLVHDWVMGETHNVLEIYVLDFTADVYDQIVEFQIGEFIHPPHNFSSLTALKVQLSQDVIAIQAAAA